EGLVRGEGPPSAQYVDVIRNPLGAAARVLDVVQPVQERVTIGSGQRLEEFARLWVLIERHPEVLGHGGLALRRIGLFQAPVSLRGLVFPKPGRLHPPIGDQSSCALSVDGRPSAPRPPRSEAL